MKTTLQSELFSLRWLSLLLIGIVIVATACNSEGAADNTLPDIQGPALIMFYTDG